VYYKSFWRQKLREKNMFSYNLPPFKNEFSWKSPAKRFQNLFLWFSKAWEWVKKMTKLFKKLGGHILEQ
jgi:hypothetical protein